MLGYRMKPITKASGDILKTFCNKTTSSLNKKLFTRDSHSLPCSNVCLLDRNSIHSLGSNNLKYSASVYRRLQTLTKSQVRWYSAQKEAGLPQLTSLPQELWPSLLTPFSNMFLSYLVIKPFVDGTFDMKEFAAASKQVVQIVSRKMAANETDGLDEMMTPETFSELKQNLARFTADQRQELAVDQDDIYFLTPAVMNFTNDREKDKKSLEIIMVYHAARGFKNLNLGDFNPFQQIQNQMQNQTQNSQEKMKLDDDKTYFLNYKFIREYSGGMASDWMLCGLNHYKKSQIVIPGLPF